MGGLQFKEHRTNSCVLYVTVDFFLKRFLQHSVVSSLILITEHSDRVIILICFRFSQFVTNYTYS